MFDKEVKKQPSKEFWPDLWRLLGPFQRHILVLLALTAVFELARMISPYLLKEIIDRLTDLEAGDLRVVLYLLAAILAVELSIEGFDYLREKKIFRLFFDVEADLHVKAQRKLVSLPLSFHEKEKTGNKIAKIEKGVDKILDLLTNIFWEVGPTLLQLVFTLVVIFFVNLYLGLSFLFFAPIFLIVTYRINRRLYPIREERYKKYEEASGLLGQVIININTVKSFVQERREMRTYRKLRDYIRDQGILEWNWLLNVNIFRSILVIAARVVVLGIGIWLITRQEITIGTLVFVYTLTEKSYNSLWRLSRFYDRVAEGTIAVGRLMKLNQQENEISSRSGGLRPNRLDGKIEFRNLSFAYEAGGNPALDNVNALINPGCVTALAGPSGGGKTTLARMIYRHYDPDSGQVLLDGRDLRDYDLHGFRRHIAIVPQDVEIFEGSIRDNVAYADPSAGLEAVRAAARIANADEFIDKLPAKYDTEVGERGVKLSGGQRQRVGIARAILANPRILIFDEATSNLDSQSEALIQAAMAKLRQGRTMIIIAHRLSTIRLADKIIVLENGRVAEQGNHIQLSQKRGGLYAKLLSLQRSGEVGE
jgi:ATP-binding cassette, subfamily B, bacterial